jgi:carbonic anhydrase
MQKLLDGVARYTSQIHGERQALFDQLATGQAPEVLFLTCADSRVDPSLITQTDPGELFVCRNAGNIVPPRSSGLAAEGMAASIEYAVKALNIAHIVVCGHAQCGAVKGAMDPESVSALGDVAAWIGHADTGGHDDLDDAIEANVLAQLRNLRSFDFITEAVAAGTLSLWGWVYDIETGAVRVHDGDRFVTVGDMAGSNA